MKNKKAKMTAQELQALLVGVKEWRPLSSDERMCFSGADLGSVAAEVGSKLLVLGTVDGEDELALGVYEEEAENGYDDGVTFLLKRC